MELLAPAGNLEKLEFAYLYGADAAYMGIRDFSLRAKADNIGEKEYGKAEKLKGLHKLYGALNIVFHNSDLKKLDILLEDIPPACFDAFIISDLGILTRLKKRFPHIPLHLSTQANCTNSEAAKMFRDLGFSRVILGRETSLQEIEEIKRDVPELELEVFVHGAMCLAYSGRCYLSSYMAGRSANRGECSHPCRWNYRVLEEQERPGEYYPAIEGDNFTTILSSRDLCMIDYIDQLAQTGVDALKIEGRMKSVYYTAVVTRAYRRAIDAVGKGSAGNLHMWKQELYKVSHREFTTGFYFSRDEADGTTSVDYTRSHIFLGTIGEALDDATFELYVKNQIRSGDTIEYIGPDILYAADDNFRLYDSEGNMIEKADHGKYYRIHPGVPVLKGYILRKKTPGKGE